MIGYVIEQELGNLLPADQSLATVLTMIEVDRDDPAFANPTKPIGPVYDRDTAERLKASEWLGHRTRRRQVPTRGGEPETQAHLRDTADPQLSSNRARS